MVFALRMQRLREPLEVGFRQAALNIGRIKVSTATQDTKPTASKPMR
jgi:hypothetical protein